MRLLAIDPGPVQSAWVIYDTETQAVDEWAKESNSAVSDLFEGGAGCDLLAVEMIASYGMAVGADVFETCVWIGRFIERWDATCRGHVRIYRRECKLHLCGSPRAKDPNIRQALIDRYGGKEQAIGRKAAPGPLYGLSGDGWAALAVAVTCAETRLGEAAESSLRVAGL